MIYQLLCGEKIANWKVASSIFCGLLYGYVVRVCVCLGEIIASEKRCRHFVRNIIRRLSGNRTLSSRYMRYQQYYWYLASNQPPNEAISPLNQPTAPTTYSNYLNLFSACVTGGAGPWDHALHLLTSTDESPRDFDVASVLKSCMRSGREDGPGVLKWRDKQQPTKNQQPTTT